MRRNNFENIIGKGQEGRIKGIKGIEKTEIYFLILSKLILKIVLLLGETNQMKKKNLILIKLILILLKIIEKRFKKMKIIIIDI